MSINVCFFLNQTSASINYLPNPNSIWMPTKLNKIDQTIKELSHKLTVPEHQLTSLIKFSESLPNVNQSSILQASLRKPSGYFSRLFSRESWVEWTEYRTPLGLALSTLSNCANGESSLRSALKSLDARTIQKASEQVKDLSQYGIPFLKRIDQLLTTLLLFPPVANAEQVDITFQPSSDLERDGSPEEEISGAMEPYIPPLSQKEIDKKLREMGIVVSLPPSAICPIELKGISKEGFQIDLESFVNKIPANTPAYCFRSYSLLINFLESQLSSMTINHYKQASKLFFRLIEMEGFSQSDRIQFLKNLSNFAIEVSVKLEGWDKHLHKTLIDFLILLLEKVPNEGEISTPILNRFNELIIGNRLEDYRQKFEACAKQYKYTYTGESAQAAAENLLNDMAPKGFIGRIIHATFDDLLETVDRDLQMLLTNKTFFSLLVTVTSIYLFKLSLNFRLNQNREERLRRNLRT